MAGSSGPSLARSNQSFGNRRIWHPQETTPTGRGILALLSGLAEEERTRILRRDNEGRTAAKKRGAKFGRKLDEHQQAKARADLAKGESCRDVAKTFGVHHSTIARLAG